jgi:superfamily II DNA or RNA helicase
MTREEKREKTQADSVSIIKERNYCGILKVAPRVGKTKIVLDSIRDKEGDVLVACPRSPVEASWYKEIEKWGTTSRIKIINHRSLHKESFGKYSLIVIDEIHMLSDYQIKQLKRARGKRVLGLTGTLKKYTERNLKYHLGLEVIADYSVENAVDDSIISDYDIHIHKLDLNDVVPNIQTGPKWKPFMTTEQGAYDYLTEQFYKFKTLSDAGVDVKKNRRLKMYFAGRRADLIYKSETKLEYARRIIEDKERALIYTARTSIADILGEKSFHSKSEGDELDLFIEGEINKLAVCKMSSVGVTIPNLKVGIFHQIHSNEEDSVQKILRMCNWEGNTKAEIHITVYRNTVDENWVTDSLSPIPDSKIHYINL